MIDTTPWLWFVLQTAERRMKDIMNNNDKEIDTNMTVVYIYNGSIVTRTDGTKEIVTGVWTVSATREPDGDGCWRFQRNGSTYYADDADVLPIVSGEEQ